MQAVYNLMPHPKPQRARNVGGKPGNHRHLLLKWLLYNSLCYMDFAQT